MHTYISPLGSAVTAGGVIASLRREAKDCLLEDHIEICSFAFPTMAACRIHFGKALIKNPLHREMIAKCARSKVDNSRSEPSSTILKFIIY